MDNTTNLTQSRRYYNSTTVLGLILAVSLPLGWEIFAVYSGFSKPGQFFYSRLIFWAEVLLLILYARKVEHGKFLLWPEKKVGIGLFIVSVLVIYLSSWVCSFVGSVPRLFGWHENNAVLKKMVLILAGRQWLIIFTCFTAGVTEELIFRGYIMTRLSLFFKKSYMPIIISALCFGGLHFGYKNLHEVIFAFLIGVVLGIHYAKYRNIKVLIAAHFMIDLINLEILTHFYRIIK